MTLVTRYIAGPGTGKTTRLISLVRHEAEEHGTGIRDLTFATFSRSMTAEVQPRIREVFPKASKQAVKDTACTLNAAALRACKAAGLIDTGDRDQIITEDRDKTVGYFIEFAALHHLPYDPARSLHAPDEDRVKGEWAGNILFRLARYIREQSWDWIHASHAEAAIGAHIPRSYGDTTEILQAWADYKADHHLYEHCDYTHLAVEEGAAPLAPVLVVDEFQDLSPAQFLLFTKWRDSGKVNRIYVAGDPNQTIYGFRGADPALLEKLPGPVEDIGATADGSAPASHRCPSAIVATADRVLGGRSNMTPRVGHAGRVWVERPNNAAGFVALVEGLRQQYGTVMVLARYRRYVRKLSRILTVAGLPHSSLISDWSPPWETARTKSGQTVDVQTLLEALDVLTSFARDRHPWVFTPAQASALMASAPRVCKPSSKIRAAIARSEVVDIPKVFGWFSDIPPLPGSARTIAAGLDFREDLTRGITAALARGPARPIPSAITLSTIHAAKGRQAPAVVLHTGYNRGRVREFWQNPAVAAEERRVDYVACTRASEALVILDGLRSGPSAPPLQAIPGVRP